MLRFTCLAFLLVGALDAHHNANILRGRQSPNGGIKTDYPFYKTSDEIHDEVVRLSKKCPGFSLDTRTKQGADGNSVSIDVVSVKKEGANPKNKMFILYGEHARELISPESSLHFLQTLCGETDVDQSGVLDNTEFRIIVNGNPHSRRKVEQGEYCLRVNENGVDLNRNWDEEWEPAAEFAPEDTNPGPNAFSEVETQVFKECVSEYQPTSFLTIHSGTLGMYMPWAYDMEHLAQVNEPEMMSILKEIDEQHCQCPFGAAGREVGYSCPGTCLDWIYDKLKVPFSFAFEIYAGEEYTENLKERWEEHAKAYQEEHNLAHKKFASLFAEHPSDFIQMERRISSKASFMQHKRNLFRRGPEDCFSQFNPQTAESLKDTLVNWSQVYVKLASMVAADLDSQSKKSAASSENSDSSSTAPAADSSDSSDSSSGE